MDAVKFARNFDCDVSDMNRVLIISLICSMIENVAMIVGIVYSAVIFHRFSLLWFLLMPLVNSASVKFSRIGGDISDGETRQGKAE